MRKGVKTTKPPGSGIGVKATLRGDACARKEPVRGWTRDSREQRTEYRVQKQRRGDGWTREGCSIRFRDSFALAVRTGGRALPECQSACASEEHGRTRGEGSRGGEFAMDM